MADTNLHTESNQDLEMRKWRVTLPDKSQHNRRNTWELEWMEEVIMQKRRWKSRRLMTGDRIFKTGVGVCVCIIHFNTFILLMREMGGGVISHTLQLTSFSIPTVPNLMKRSALLSSVFLYSPNFCLNWNLIKRRPSKWQFKQRREITHQKLSDCYDNLSCTPPPPLRAAITVKIGEMYRRDPVRLRDEVLYIRHGQSWSGQLKVIPVLLSVKVKGVKVIQGQTQSQRATSHLLNGKTKFNMWAVRSIILSCHLSGNVIIFWSSQNAGCQDREKCGAQS